MGKRRIKAIDALKMAIKRENGAYEFYNSASVIVVDPSGKTMLNWLAKEEARHIAQLKRQLKSLLSTKSWLNEDNNTSPIQKTEFPSQSEASGKVSAHINDIDVLRTAINFEKEAIEFYKQAEESTPDLSGMLMFTTLVGEEEGHLRLLKEELTWINKYDRYFTLNRFESMY